MRGQFTEVDVHSWWDDPGEFECWTDTNAAPHLFGVTALEHVPPPPYLRAAATLDLGPHRCKVALERADTPWYPSARLFRQPRIGAWEPVFEQVAAALRELAEQHAIQRH